MKAFLSLEQQMDYLRSEKGLLIPDPVFAEAKLTQIGYFGLIGGYKDAFKNPATGTYRFEIRFEDIVALYELDENLRELFFRHLLRIERHLRSLMSYHFTEKYGENQSQYLNPANFTQGKRHASDVRRLVRTLDHIANTNSDYRYIGHQRRKYGNVPLWVLMNALSFGTLAKFYLMSHTGMRTKISKHFDHVGETQLEQFLSVLTKFRNVCAHNERLFSYQTRNAITDMPIHAKLGIPKNGSQYKCGKQDLFAVVIAFKYLLSEEDFKAFKNGLVRIVGKYFASTAALTEAELTSMMGFPENWKSITRYKK
jgi:abortive infection bacteriophage resistance protein